MENLTISAASWLKPPTAPRKSATPRYLSQAYWHNNQSKLLFLGSYTCVNVLLFAQAAHRHAGSGACIAVAKGCGQCLNFNCTFAGVLMLRRCLTWLRATWVARVLPLDQNIVLHQLVGYVTVAFTAIHTGAHLANFVRMSQATDGYHFWEYLFTTWPGIGWVYGTASITGLLLQLLICLMLVCSSAFVRQSGHFEVFYWTHLSYIFIWALLVVHGPNFWKWFAVPGFLFLAEKLFGAALSHIGALYIVEINLLPSKVTHLVIQRPPFFHYKPGDYIYLNIPVIAKYEWHPFTISSAPEQPGTLWLHIRSLGQWTNRLYEHFCQDPGLLSQGPECSARSQWKKKPSQKGMQKYLSASPDMDDIVATNDDEMVEILSCTPIRYPGQETSIICVSTWHEEVDAQSRGDKISSRPGGNRRLCNIKCYLDGPYGTPTRRIFTSEHAVLIGAGIGITPFASILQSIMYRYRMRKQISDSQGFAWSDSFKSEDMKLQKVDFIWINRDQTSFEWFVSLLTQLEINQADEDPNDRFLEMHLYMTSALSKNDMKAIGLQMALDLLAKKEKQDSITGLKTRTQPGRPDWNKVAFITSTLDQLFRNLGHRGPLTKTWGLSQQKGEFKAKNVNSIITF